MQQWLEERLLKLNLTETMEKPDGFSRLSYSAEEWAARAKFIELAEELGLAVREDAAGNAIARWNPPSVTEEAPAIAFGSHVDTVTNGGGYDGVAGVLCALATVYQLQEDGFVPAKPLEVICFASEESARFGVSTIGSKAMSGLLDKDTLADVKDQDGVTIKEAVEERGLVYDDTPSAARSEAELEEFIELHIEQGTRVEQAGADVGAVTAIACPIRLQVDGQGKAGHTGTTPMDRRKDALVMAAELITFVYERAQALNERGGMPIVATASTVSCEPNVMNVIPDRVQLGIDIRSVSDALKEELAADIRAKSAEIMARFRVTLEIATLVNNPSVQLDPSIHEALVGAAGAAGLTNYTLESGAGHDVMNMAHRWPAGLLFIPCRDGLSHHPDEHASLADLENGVKVLTAYVKNKAGD
ncbi:M20 family metallo-hydrolase [Salisediminibacterium halotolerans]|uniref:N-carbamoyl-L-amino-acid hydrolase n=1 Tax=Salisediminibacterium halotolerans TaxID=517425 RepID=A0A1H9W3T9_9BACI|nr:M20 family metallo-hydrolase [Salisediminibacterium haloalkalitolerans]SES28449.1 N-carbamoyl-L-amino-acid hydrolase [Salisediminibacterium haloalkalitolerans]